MLSSKPKIYRYPGYILGKAERDAVCHTRTHFQADMRLFILPALFLTSAIAYPLDFDPNDYVGPSNASVLALLDDDLVLAANWTPPTGVQHSSFLLTGHSGSPVTLITVLTRSAAFFQFTKCQRIAMVSLSISHQWHCGRRCACTSGSSRHLIIVPPHSVLPSLEAMGWRWSPFLLFWGD